MSHKSSPALQKYFCEDAPAFGKEVRDKLFYIDPEYIPLNHGSYGATPKPVQEFFDEVDRRIEASTDLFMRIDLPPLLDELRERIANFLCVGTDECYLVTNASMGLATILRNFEWHAEDVIITTSLTYGSIQKTATYLSDLAPNPKVSIMPLTFPTTHAEILSNFRAHIDSLVKERTCSSLTAFAQTLGLKKRRDDSGPRVKTMAKGKMVAIIDGTVSTPGALMPWKEMVKICNEYGVWSVIDGAHCIGSEQNIDLAGALPDFYVTNFHKWFTAKKACAVMYVPQRNHHIIKSSIPTVAGYPNASLKAMYNWNGTIDWASYISVYAAMDMREWLGGEAKIYEYCHDLVIKGSKRVAEILGTELLHGENMEFITTMCEVRLPIASNDPAVRSEVNLAFKRKMLVERKAFVSNYYHNGKWWGRCSAQVYNTMEDFEKIGKIILEVCKELDAEYPAVDLALVGGERDFARQGRMESGEKSALNSFDEKSWASSKQVVKYEPRRVNAMRNPVRWVLYLLGF